MTRKNIFYIGLTALFALALVCGSFTNGHAQQKQVPKALKEELRKALADLEKGGQEHEVIERMKKAGASYFPELTAPVQKGKTLRNIEVQRQIVGVYTMDMAYASVFGKNKESLQFAEAIDSGLTGIGFTNRKITNRYKKAMKDFQGADSKKAFAELDKAIDATLEEALQTPAGMELAVEATYGWWVEGLYLTTEIAAQKNYHPKFIAFVNDQKKTTQTMMRIFDLFKKYPEFAAMMDVEERMPIVRGILNKLKKADKIGKADIDAIRGTVSEARTGILK